MLDDLYATADSLKSIFNSFECNCDQNRNNPIANKNVLQHVYASKPILGPDRIPVQDCMNFAESTAEKCLYLMALVPKAHVQITLQILIDDLEKRAKSCCKAGGIWKACLQPIVD